MRHVQQLLERMWVQTMTPRPELFTDGIIDFRMAEALVEDLASLVGVGP